MNKKERSQELMRFISEVDLDEEEYEELQKWVDEGNSPYTNPDHFCIAEKEVSFIKWYWILANAQHPYHKTLMEHRYRLEDQAGNTSRWQKLIKAKAEEFLNTDYSKSVLRPGQDWYMGDNTFLSLSETKEFLLGQMDYVKEAFQRILSLEKNIEELLSEMNITGNVFTDVLEASKVLGWAEIFAEELLGAIADVETYEQAYEKKYFGSLSKKSDELPF